MNRGQRRAAWLAQHRHGSPARAESPAVSAGRQEVPLTRPANDVAATAAPRSSVRLHVEELHLVGFAARDRHVLGESLQQELKRLIVEQGLPKAFTLGGETERLDAGSFTLATGMKASVVGARIARAVHGGPRR